MTFDTNPNHIAAGTQSDICVYSNIVCGSLLNFSSLLSKNSLGNCISPCESKLSNVIPSPPPFPLLLLSSSNNKLGINFDRRARSKCTKIWSCNSTIPIDSGPSLPLVPLMKETETTTKKIEITDANIDALGIIIDSKIYLPGDLETGTLSSFGISPNIEYRKMNQSKRLLIFY